LTTLTKTRSKKKEGEVEGKEKENGNLTTQLMSGGSKKGRCAVKEKVGILEGKSCLCKRPNIPDPSQQKKMERGRKKINLRAVRSPALKKRERKGEPRAG